MACPWENFSVGICVRGEGFQGKGNSDQLSHFSLFRYL